MGRLLLSSVASAVLSLAIITPATAGDYAQLISSAGLSAAEARGMSLDEIAAHKFNRDGRDSRQTVARREPAETARGARQSSRTGAGMSLDEIFVEKLNKNVRADERHVVPEPAAYSDPRAREQLIAASGLDPEEAEGASLDLLAAHTFYRGTSGDERAPIPR